MHVYRRLTLKCWLFYVWFFWHWCSFDQKLKRFGDRFDNSIRVQNGGENNNRQNNIFSDPSKRNTYKNLTGGLSLVKGSTFSTDEGAFTQEPNLDKEEGNLMVLNTSLQTIQWLYKAPSTYPSTIKTVTDVKKDAHLVCFKDGSLIETVSCKGNCGVYIKEHCSCDEYCLIYRNCCFDYQDVCFEDWKAAKEKHEKFIGAPLECLRYKPGYYVISGCKENTSSNIDKLCAMTGRNPVTWNRVLHFKNRYCLQCYGLDNTLVKDWTAKLGVISRPSNSKYENRKLNELLESIQPFWVVDEVSHLRICYKEAVDSCPQGTASYLNSLCLSDRSQVVMVDEHKNGTFFVNKYCAECHMGSISNSVCKFLNAKDFKDGPRMQFAYLMSWLDEKRVSLTLVKQMIFKWTELVCSNFQLDNCTVVRCQENITPVNNECKPRTCLQIGVTINNSDPKTTSQMMRTINVVLRDTANNINGSGKLTFFSRYPVFHDSSDFSLFLTFKTPTLLTASQFNEVCYLIELNLRKRHFYEHGSCCIIFNSISCAVSRDFVCQIEHNFTDAGMENYFTSNGQRTVLVIMIIWGGILFMVELVI